MEQNINIEENKELNQNEVFEINQSNNKDKKNKEDKMKSKKINIITTKEYTEKELTDLIRNKYSIHNKYYKVLQEIINKISEKEFKEIDEAINMLEEVALNKEKLPIEQLKKYTIQIPILMYRLNDKLGNKGLDMEISSYLNNLEISEKIFEQIGGTEKERLRAAEYNSMVSTFTSIIKSRLYYNLKTKLDYSSKVYDGLKKVLSAEIEEMKLFGKDINK